MKFGAEVSEEVVKSAASVYSGKRGRETDETGEQTGYAVRRLFNLACFLIAQRSAYVEGILSRFPMLDIDMRTARMHAHIWAALRGAGRMIGPNDFWIAASALAHGLTLVTGNLREFERVPGLSVECWA